jgi:hypothetical protein
MLTLSRQGLVDVQLSKAGTCKVSQDRNVNAVKARAG